VARKPAAPSKTALAALWLVRRAAGSDAEVIRWLKAYREPKKRRRKRGRPRNTSLDIFLQMIEQYHGQDWDQGRIIAPYSDPNPGRRGKRSSSPHAVLRRYVEAVWQPRENEPGRDSASRRAQGLCPQASRDAGHRAPYTPADRGAPAEEARASASS